MKGLPGQRKPAAVRGRSRGPACPRCDPLQRENESLQQETGRLRRQAEAQKGENARLREGLSEASPRWQATGRPLLEGCP